MDGLLFHHSWGKRNNHQGLPQNHLLALVHHFLGLGYRRLYLCLLPGLSALFRLLSAFCLPPLVLV